MTNFSNNPYAPIPYGYQPKLEYAAAPPYGYQTGFPQNYLKCRPVSSVEEARAAQIDLDGSLFVFPDIANQRIYTKQINPDGTATLNTYTLTLDTPKAELQYVTKDELDTILAAFRSSLAGTEPKATSAPAAAKPKFNL